MSSRYPYKTTDSGRIVIDPQWRRDCHCRMDPCNVPWHYRRVNPRTCVCRVYPIPQLHKEMIVYTRLCKYGAHWWYGSRKPGNHSYQPYGTQYLARYGSGQ